MPIPDSAYERNVAQLVRYYKKAFKEILGQMKGIQNGIERAQAESLLKQIDFILRELDENTKRWCQTTINDAFKRGQIGCIIKLGDAKTLAEAASQASFSMLARETVEALINDTYEDLLLATQNTKRKVVQLVKSAASDTLRLRAAQQLGRRTSSKEIVERLAGRGLSRTLDDEAWVGIVDKAGRRWNLSTYSEMVVRTKLQQAHIEGVRTEALERKVDLAVISSHGARDACAKFEGMVISLNGITPGYPTYTEVRATGQIFHPNCQHSVNALRDISLLPPALRERHAEQLKNAEKVLGKTF
jgi:hypothetical protein